MGEIPPVRTGLTIASVSRSICISSWPLTLHDNKLADISPICHAQKQQSIPLFLLHASAVGRIAYENIIKQSLSAYAPSGKRIQKINMSSVYTRTRRQQPASKKKKDSF